VRMNPSGPAGRPFPKTLLMGGGKASKGLFLLVKGQGFRVRRATALKPGSWGWSTAAGRERGDYGGAGSR
jgi:hypothetical protein